jgi:hypothetical protein
MRNIIIMLSLTLILSNHAYSEIKQKSGRILECNFPDYSNQSGAKKASGFSFKIFIDEVTRSAYLIGNAGSSPLQLVDYEDKINLIEITPSKNITITTILNDGTAVHSRQPVIFDEIIPSQYYGRCK